MFGYTSSCGRLWHQPRTTGDEHICLTCQNSVRARRSHALRITPTPSRSLRQTYLPNPSSPASRYHRERPPRSGSPASCCELGKQTWHSSLQASSSSSLTMDLLLQHVPLCRKSAFPLSYIAPLLSPAISPATSPSRIRRFKHSGLVFPRNSSAKSTSSRQGSTPITESCKSGQIRPSSPPSHSFLGLSYPRNPEKHRRSSPLLSSFIPAIPQSADVQKMPTFYNTPHFACRAAMTDALHFSHDTTKPKKCAVLFSNTAPSHLGKKKKPEILHRCQTKAARPSPTWKKAKHNRGHLA
ncbi:hypothetical protein BDP81DRAFT_35668 [Colletotrichum phormii]|uniref:Uncharacterized protein n=1 Tax=Colletotrichum phormii TaxID=359342 RepID=A0AAJ0EGR9_9PEZI|nr:uncharacterized protein BDP81DRAFT_35668 [Colletotrichum phormii]KAK1636250.1 hypothetical protein BDP81DRAFT_35668 [Colletotrichum phormii]